MVIPPLYPPRKEVNGCNTGPVIISIFPLVFSLFWDVTCHGVERRSTVQKSTH